MWSLKPGLGSCSVPCCMLTRSSTKHPRPDQVDQTKGKLIKRAALSPTTFSLFCTWVLQALKVSASMLSATRPRANLGTEALWANMWATRVTKNMRGIFEVYDTLAMLGIWDPKVSNYSGPDNRLWQESSVALSLVLFDTPNSHKLQAQSPFTGEPSDFQDPFARDDMGASKMRWNAGRKGKGSLRIWPYTKSR